MANEGEANTKANKSSVRRTDVGFVAVARFKSNAERLLVA